jgi:MFS family permease
MRIYIAHGFSWIGVQAMFVYIIAFIQQKMLATSDPGAIAEDSGRIIAISFAILNTVGFLLPAPVLEPLAMRFGRVRVHLTALAIMAAAYFAIAFAGASPVMLYLLMAVAGIGWASIVSLPFAIMTEKVEKSRMGFFMGIFNLSVVLPQLFVSLVLGTVIYRSEDKSIIFLISGVSLAVSAVVWLLVHEPGRNAATNPAGGNTR